MGVEQSELQLTTIKKKKKGIYSIHGKNMADAKF